MNNVPLASWLCHCMTSIMAHDSAGVSKFGNSKHLPQKMASISIPKTCKFPLNCFCRWCDCTAFSENAHYWYHKHVHPIFLHRPIVHKPFQNLYHNGRRTTRLVYTGVSYVQPHYMFHFWVCFIDFHCYCVFIALAQGAHTLALVACTSMHRHWWPMPLDLYCSTACCVLSGLHQWRELVLQFSHVIRRGMPMHLWDVQSLVPLPYTINF